MNMDWLGTRAIHEHRIAEWTGKRESTRIFPSLKDRIKSVIRKK